MELAVVVKGEVVSSNLVEFRTAVTAFVAAINRNLTTDLEFGQAEDDVKQLKKLEEVHKLSMERVLEQASGINALLKELEQSGAEVSKVRLELEKTIKSRKEAVKSQLVSTALNKLECAPHLRLKTFGSVVENSIKGKKTLESMEKSLAQIVGSLNEQLKASKAVIAEYEANNEVVPDADTLMLGNAENVRLVLAQRKQAREAAEEKKRLEKLAEDERNARIKAEAQAKAEREQAQRESAIGQTVLVETVAAPIATSAHCNCETPGAHFHPGSNGKFCAVCGKDILPSAPAVVAPGQATAEEEMSIFMNVCLNAFAQLKTARAEIKHEENAVKIDAFRGAINAAWKVLKGGAA
jgi:hypothetical protein